MGDPVCLRYQYHHVDLKLRLSSFLLEVPIQIQYTDRMKNKNTRQFDSIEAIDLFVAEADNGTLDNIWENIQDEYDAYTNEEEQVQAFNQAMRDMAELIS